MCNEKRINIYYKSNRYIWSTEDICTMCNTMEEESLEHFLCHCPLYTALRNKYIHKYIGDVVKESRLEQLIAIKCRQQIDDIFYYCTGALKLRAFVINQ